MTANMFIMSLHATLIAAAPLLFASVGAVYSERSGVSNLGIEGIMLMGAVSGFMAAVRTGSLAGAILTVILVGTLIGLAYAFLTVTLHANQTVCGLALTIFGEGLSAFLGSSVSGITAPLSVVRIPIPILSKIPVLGTILFNHDIFIYALYLIIPLSCLYLFRTKPGLALRAVGENPAAVDDTGRNVAGLRYGYVIFGCIMAAIGGAYLSLVYAPSWTNGMTAGKGWIAVALVIFSTWHPALAAVGALLFGGIDVFSTRIQAIGVNIPAYFIRMLPYLFTIVVLILYTGDFAKRKVSAPKALGVPYDREER